MPMVFVIQLVDLVKQAFSVRHLCVIVPAVVKQAPASWLILSALLVWSVNSHVR